MATYARSTWGRVQVNWLRDGLAGITYLEGPVKGGSAVVRVDELELTPPAPDTPADLRELSTDELRARLRDLRATRRATEAPPKKASQKTRVTVDPTPKTSQLASAITALTPEQARALLAQLLGGGAGTHG